MITVIFLYFLNISLQCFAASQTPVGGACLHHSDCVGKPGITSVCNTLTQKCACKDGFVSQRDLFDCLIILHNEGDRCKESSQCQQGSLKGLSECSERRCTCIKSAVKDPNIPECLPRAFEIGGECISDVQCAGNLTELAYCDGISGTCKCKAFISVPKSDSSTCLGKVLEIGGICEESPQCQFETPGIYSECVEANKIQTCQCKENSTNPEGSNECLPFRGLQESCKQDIQCTSVLGNHSECKIKAGGNTKGKCLCRKGAVINELNSSCIPVADKLGQECEVDDQCRKGTPGPYSRCSVDAASLKAICTCDEEAVQLPGEEKCRKSAEFIGDFCFGNEQCWSSLGNQSLCNGKVCICQPGSVPTSDKRRCLKGPLKIGENCEDVAQCVTNADCTETRHCLCNTNFVPNFQLNKCLPIRRIGDNCEETAQCQGGPAGNWSDCLWHNFTEVPRKLCNCTNQAVAPSKGDKCYRKATHVGDSCEIGDQCTVSLGYSSCEDGACVCFPTSNPSSDKRRCVLKAELGEECFDNAQCSHILPLNSTVCHGIPTQCQCKPGYIQKDKVCFKLTSIIGGRCDNDVECSNIEGATCTFESNVGYCHCNYNSSVANMNKTKCLPRRTGLGENNLCEEDVQCIVNKSECGFISSMRACICQPDYVSSVRFPNKCLEIVSEVDRECQDDIQCTTGIDELAICLGNLCQCRSSYSFYGGHCYRPVPLGGACSQHVECKILGGNLTECVGICKCQKDSIEMDGVCQPHRIIGADCQHTRECSLHIGGKVYCNQGRCDCLPFSSPTFGGTMCSMACLIQTNLFHVVIITLVIILSF